MEQYNGRCLGCNIFIESGTYYCKAGYCRKCCREICHKDIKEKKLKKDKLIKVHCINEDCGYYDSPFYIKFEDYRENGLHCDNCDWDEAIMEY